MPDLGDELRRAAGGGPHAYDATDVRRTATRRARTRRAGAGLLAAVALIGGIGFALRDDETSMPLETVDDPYPTVTTTEQPPGTGSTVAPDDTGTTVPACGDPMPDLEQVRDDVGADLDGDGTADRFHSVQADDETGGSWIQLERSSDGTYTSAVRLVGFFNLGGPLDAADIDGDGAPEVFFSLSGNTALTGVVLDLEGCDLTAVTTDSPAFDDGDGIFTYLHAAGGNSCAPTGCRQSVVCTPGAPSATLTLTSIFPSPNALEPDFDFDEWERVPIADRPVRFLQERVRIIDGATVTVSTADETTTVGELDSWWRRDGVECSATLQGEACGLLPPLDAVVDGWSMSDNTFWTEPGGGTATWVRGDGAVVEIRNPAAPPAADDIGSLDIVGRPALLAAAGIDGSPPVSLTWSESTQRPFAGCETWSLTSTDLDADELARFARDAFGAGLLARFYETPVLLTDDEIFDYVEDFQREMISWAADDIVPTELIWAHEIRRFAADAEAAVATPEEMSTWEGWTLSNDGITIVTRNAFATRAWNPSDPLVDECGIEAPPIADGLDQLQPIRITPHPDLPCGEWTIIELFLRPDHSFTIEAVRILSPNW